MNTHERNLLEVLADDRIGDPAQSALVKKLLGEFDELVKALEKVKHRLETRSTYDEMVDTIQEVWHVLKLAKGENYVDEQR